MASALTLPDGVRPSNLHLPAGATATFIDGDLYDICARMRELDPNLYAVLLEHGGTGYSYAIMERCADGVERLIFKVRELDNRVIDKLREIMAIPLEHRYRELEKREYKLEEERRERELDELYERMGAPMWGLMERTGFSQRPVSYPKAGVAGGRGSLRREQKGALIAG